MKRVDKKTCVITGAALGIGKACAERLADEGANIAVFDRLDDDGNALVKALQDRGVNARYWHVDVSSEKNVQTAITKRRHISAASTYWSTMPALQASTNPRMK